MPPMKSYLLPTFVLLLTGCVCLAGCATTEQQQATTMGAVQGAAVGAAVGSRNNSVLGGAVLGAVMGGTTAAILSQPASSAQPMFVQPDKGDE